mmetsp:Transcript_113019/g.359029  ORF Transcript_113019/g.359029 Transcript_113019/m.359029 type:complete len:85 (-) Transcript_113019:100-354(-)
MLPDIRGCLNSVRLGRQVLLDEFQCTLVVAAAFQSSGYIDPLGITWEKFPLAPIHQKRAMISVKAQVLVARSLQLPPFCLLSMN